MLRAMAKPTPQVETLPAGAFHFLAPAEFAADTEAGSTRRKVRGVAYSGEVITGHSYWEAVIFDLATTKVEGRIPLLVDHDRSKRAGFAVLAITGDRIEIQDAELLDNDTGRGVAADADAGFPWQLSVHIQPSRIERLDSGQMATVNGRTVEGPATIFRNSLIREVSFTPTGADHRTAAQVFAAEPDPPADNAPPEKPPIEEPDPMHTPEQFAALQSQVGALTAERDAALAAVAARDTELATIRSDARFADVRGLFAEIGHPEPKRDDVAAYIGMTAEQFTAVAADLRRAKPTLPQSLFGHVAIGDVGAQGAGQGVNLGDSHQFAAAIRAEVAAALSQGRRITPVEAAATIRARASVAA